MQFDWEPIEAAKLTCVLMMPGSKVPSTVGGSCPAQCQPLYTCVSFPSDAWVNSFREEFDNKVFLPPLRTAPQGRGVLKGRDFFFFVFAKDSP